MFGTNPIRKQILQSDRTLEVQSIFSTVQGEGPFAGQPAIFVRLAGCNLRCHFCDTDFETKRRVMRVGEIGQTIHDMAHKDKVAPTKLVVLTGGEPLRQNIIPLIEFLTIDLDYHVQIETAGTLWIDRLEWHIYRKMVTIVCSPKAGSVHNMVHQWCNDWKYLIREGEIDKQDGLPNVSTQIVGKPLRLARPPMRKDTTVWLQPCEEYFVDRQAVNTDALLKDQVDVGELADQKVTRSVVDVERTKQNLTLAGIIAMRFNYRVSLQTHKYLNLP